MIKFRDTMRHMMLKSYLGAILSVTILGAYFVNVGFLITEQVKVVGVYEKDGVNTVVMGNPNGKLKTQEVTQATAKLLKDNIGKTITNKTINMWGVCLFIVLVAVLGFCVVDLFTSYNYNKRIDNLINVLTSGSR